MSDQGSDEESGGPRETESQKRDQKGEGSCRGGGVETIVVPHEEGK